MRRKKKRINRYRYPKHQRRPNLTRDFNSPSYKRWRTAVFERDGHRCQMPNCGSRKRLQAHHIEPWSTNIYTRFLVNNGITLCFWCHKNINKKETFYIPLFHKIIAYQLLNKLKTLKNGHNKTKSNKRHKGKTRLDI